VFGAFDWTDTAVRARWMRVIMIVLPIVWGTLGVLAASPLLLVVIAGILNALFLMGVSVATVYLSRTQTDPAVKGGRGYTAMLLISAVAIFAVGILGLVDLVS